MNKLSGTAFASLASLLLVAGCAVETRDEAGAASADLSGTSATSAYTDVSITTPLDACTSTQMPAGEVDEMGDRYDCGAMGRYTLVAGAYEETSAAPFIRTPTGTYYLDAFSAGVNTRYGYLGKKAEWRGRGIAIGQVEPTALILRIFTPGQDETGYGTFTGDNSLIVAKITPDNACVFGTVSGAVANHNQLARDMADSQAFKDFVCPAQTPEPLAPTGCGTLQPNTGLEVGGALSSCSGSHSLVMQDDGNLVIYNRAGKATWSSRTAGASVRAAILRGDGTLGVYGGALDAAFQTPTAGNEGATLAMQDDGNLVIYSKDGRALWASNTAGK
ncbi:MAG: hypothetical protein U0270_37305 [Labilithrix sp.]